MRIGIKRYWHAPYLIQNLFPPSLSYLFFSVPTIVPTLLIGDYILDTDLTIKMMGDTPPISPPLKRVFLSPFPHPLNNHLKQGISLHTGLFPIQDSCSTRRVGLTAQTPEVALIPPVRLVSAYCHLHRKGLDGGRNDIASFRLFGAIRNSTTPEFHSDIYWVYLPVPHSLQTRLGDISSPNSIIRAVFMAFTSLYPAYNFQLRNAELIKL